MDKPRIALIVDHPLRDLGGLCLVAWELARSGAEAYLVPFNWQTREVLALAPDLVVLNYLRPNNESFVDALIAANIGYAMLDTEGGFYGDLAKYGQVMSRNSAHLRALRCMCVWGRKMYDYLAAHPDLTPAQLVITGLPRFDLYAPWLHDVAIGFLPREWREPKPLFLINTKISIANSQFQSRQKEIETYVRVLGVPRADVDRHIALGERAIEQICELAAGLGTRHPRAAVMIRPHPHERLQTYSDLLGDAPENVVVNCEGGVTPWILRSSALIHRQCTTAVEAALAGVPAIAPQWLSTSADVPDAEAVSHRCDSTQELDDLLNAAQRGALPPATGSAAILERIVDDWLFRIDGLSHKRA
ncbi:MAG: surface carbohydrate biosynthesis protein, partial [Gammaproteobacteria bacterium]